MRKVKKMTLKDKWYFDEYGLLPLKDAIIIDAGLVNMIRKSKEITLDNASLAYLEKKLSRPKLKQYMPEHRVCRRELSAAVNNSRYLRSIIQR